MKLTPQTYQKMAEQASPPTKSRITIPSAFLIGGGICTLGEVFLNLFTRMGAEKEAASAWASICLIFLSALFTGLGLYEKLAKFAGAGTWCPLRALPTPWYPRRWSPEPRASCWGWGQSCSPSPGR